MPRRSYEYRIYPNQQQSEQMSAMLGGFCTLYNAGLEERISAYRIAGIRRTYHDQALTLRDCREGYPDLARWSFSAEQQVLRRLDKAFKAFFRRLKSGEKPGFPRFRNRSRYHAAEFRVGDGLRLKNERIGFVGVDGLIKVKWHRELASTPKSAILVNRAGTWAIIFHVEVDAESIAQRRPSVVGVDAGLSSLVALSNGDTIPTPQWFNDSQAKRRRLARALARRKRNSSGRRKARQNYARHSQKIAAQRRDFQHKLTRRLVDSHTHIAIEELSIKGLARGMLAKSFHNAAWGQLIAFLTYKAESAGTIVEAINPRGTSQTCTCGAEVAKTLRVRVHRCNACGLVADRDVVSAQVVLQRSSFGVGATLGARSIARGLRLAPQAVCFS